MLQSEDVVLHLEFQTVADSSMPFRMADYRLRVYRRYPNKDMRQVVIYLKETGSELVQQNSFTISGMRHEFEIIRLWEQDYSDFLNFPGLLPLAVLGRSDNRTQTLREVSSVIDRIGDRGRQIHVPTRSVTVVCYLYFNGFTIVKDRSYHGKYPPEGAVTRLSHS